MQNEVRIHECTSAQDALKLLFSFRKRATNFTALLRGNDL